MAESDQLNRRRYRCRLDRTAGEFCQQPAKALAGTGRSTSRIRFPQTVGPLATRPRDPVDRESVTTPKTVLSNYRVENVLVIGGAGYIGSVLVRQLLALGYRVRVLDRLTFGREPILGLSLLPGFELLPGDFRNPHVLAKAAQQMDAVIHLGAIVGDPACALDERAAMETNYEATALVAQTAKDLGVSRLVFASTCSVYGTSNQAVDERAIPRPVSLYAATKADSERILLAFASNSLHPTVLRIGTAFGWSHRPRFDLAVNLLTARAQIEGKIVVHNSDQWRPFIHVRDIGSAFCRVLEAPLGEVSGQIFNVGSNETNHQLADVAQTIRLVFPEVSVVYETNSDRRDYRVSFDKIRGLLGFECGTSLHRGILEVSHALERGSVRDYTEPIYHNHRRVALNGAVASTRQARQRASRATSAVLPGTASRAATAADVSMWKQTDWAG